MNVTLNSEEHPNWYHDIPKMKILILGSYPPHKDKRHYEFYYPNKVNRFWDILAGIKGYELSYREGPKAVKERHWLMEHMNIGVQNMGLKINRKGKSAADKDIEITEFQDILDILRKHRELNKILLPGYSGKSSTFHSFIRYLGENRIVTDAPKRPQHGSRFELKLEGRIIECVVLNSTSPRTGLKLKELISRFSEFI